MDVLSALMYRLSCVRPIRTIVRNLGLRRLVRGIYDAAERRDFRRHKGVLPICFSGHSVLVSVRSVSEFRAVQHVIVSETDPLTIALSGLACGDCFLDVGSANGVYALLAARAVTDNGAVIAIEPYPDSYRAVSDNFVLNGFRHARVLPVAFSDRVGEVGISDTDQDGNTACPKISGKGRIVVSAVPGDELLAQHALPVPRVIKIDVEGHEQAVLRGLSKTLSDPSCQMVCLEVHPQLGADVSGIISFLEKHGFDCTKHDSGRPEFHLFARKQNRTPAASPTK